MSNASPEPDDQHEPADSAEPAEGGDSAAESDPLRLVLHTMEEQLDDRVGAVSDARPARDESTAELIRLEETLSSAQDKAKQLVTLRLKLSGEQGAAETAATEGTSADTDPTDAAPVDTVPTDEARAAEAARTTPRDAAHDPRQTRDTRPPRDTHAS